MVRSEKIIYITTEFGITDLFFKDSTHFSTESSLNSLLKILDPNLFFRISRQTIVNTNYVDEIRFFNKNNKVVILQPPYDKIALHISDIQYKKFINSRLFIYLKSND